MYHNLLLCHWPYWFVPVSANQCLWKHGLSRVLRAYEGCHGHIYIQCLTSPSTLLRPCRLLTRWHGSEDTKVNCSAFSLRKYMCIITVLQSFVLQCYLLAVLFLPHGSVTVAYVRVCESMWELPTAKCTPLHCISASVHIMNENGCAWQSIQHRNRNACHRFYVSATSQRFYSTCIYMLHS